MTFYVTLNEVKGLPYAINEKLVLLIKSAKIRLIRSISVLFLKNYLGSTVNGSSTGAFPLPHDFAIAIETS